MARFRILKALKPGKSASGNLHDSDGIDAFRGGYTHQDLLMSACYYTAPDPLAPRIYPLGFDIACSDVEQTRMSTLETCYYITRFNIAADGLEIVYTGGGNVTNDVAIEDSGADRDSRKTAYIIEGNSNGAGNHKSNGSYYYTGDSYNLDIGSKPITKASDGTAPSAEMIILIALIVFNGQLTSPMPALNYHLALQMTETGIQNLDIDGYSQLFIPLPNSIRTATGRYVIPLTMKELLYLSSSCISELTKQQSPEDSMIVPQRMPEAIEWFAEFHGKFVKKQCQEGLRKLMLEKGWQIPPCIRRLSWADLAKEATLEACRLISRTYSFLGGHKDKIRYDHPGISQA